MNRGKIAVLAATLLGVTACTKLDVTNPNNPERDRVLAAPADVEGLISSSFNTYIQATNTYYGPALFMAVMSFEHSATPANSGMEERARIPRIAFNNQQSDAFAANYERVWYRAYRALAAVNEGIRRINGGTVITDSTTTLRAKAFAKFVQGLSHGVLAQTYDKAFIYTETDDPSAPGFAMKPYGEVMATALQELEDAATMAESKTFTIPSTWMSVTGYTNMDLARLARSYKARFRAEVARTPAERAAVNWTALIADVDKGITKDFAPVSDNVNWYDETVYYGSLTQWSQMAYWIYGMADVSGGYQSWIATPTASKLPFLLVTPDKRFPQGTTVAAQQAAPGKYLAYKGTLAHNRPERGTWRWSYYRDTRNDGWMTNPFVGPTTEFNLAELRMLKAEGLIRTNNAAAAVPLINVSRQANGGLPAVTVDGVPQAADCVPKLPNGSCGSLLEAMKWEKRLEVYKTGFATFYFDSRGWGDLMEGTPLQLPVPAKELNTLQMGVYTFGGVGLVGGAPKGTYGF